MKALTCDKLEPGMVLAQDVFAGGDPVHAFMRRGTRLTGDAITRLAVRGVQRVYVREEARPAGAAPLLRAAHSSVVPAPPTIDGQLRADALDAVQQAFNDVWVEDGGAMAAARTAGEMDKVVEKLVGAVLRTRGAALNVAGLKSFDDITYHHSLAVAVLAIGIGQQLGLHSKQLYQLGLAAILHDVGKTLVPLELLRKPGRLSTEELRLMRAHARAGTTFLAGSSIGGDGLWSTVLHHHERMDGSGYPAGLRGEKIPLHSRIIAVADVYDAVTSNRPYHRPMPPAEAVEYLMGGAGGAFDYDVVRALMDKVALYPVGSCVELSDGSCALVLGGENPLRPVVEVLGQGTVVDLGEDRRYLSVVIRQLLQPGALPGGERG